MAYVNSVSSQVGSLADVVKLKRTVPSLSELSAENVELVQVPERWLPTSSPNRVEELAGKATAGELIEGSYLQHGMLMQAPGLEPGYREVAIMVNAEVGVVGKVSSGDRVDIIAASRAPNTKVRDARVEVQNALVIDVGVVTTTGEDSKNGGFPGGDLPDDSGDPDSYAGGHVLRQSRLVLVLGLGGAADRPPRKEV